MHVFNEEEREILTAVKRFCEDRIKPAASAIDEEDVFPRELYTELGKAGILALTAPEEYGGLEISVHCWLECLSLISAASASLSMSVTACSSLMFLVSRFASEELGQKCLPKLATGEAIMCACITEPNAGSDVSSIATTAVLDGEHYLVNGSKIFITSGSVADYFVIFAKTRVGDKEGLICLLADKTMPGIRITRDEKKLGMRGSVTSELWFEDLRVPIDHVIGNAGDGFKVAYNTLERGRLYVAAMGLGIARAAQEAAVEYSKTRVQYGKPICKYQAIQNKLVDMEIGIDAGHALVHSIAERIERGEQTIKQASCAKVFCSELAERVTAEALQVFGGYGYCKDYPVERYFRDAKALPIFEGANEVQRNIIGKVILA
ncbi:MAG: acyl-CoA dehydrogenase family protein [Coriobacteriia bacterium]|nr:acyl-CoA dehydrogenase family protein [Coriobacteriia bacterium]MCL2749642.1 acyl-CoA dehydrogenase family protein [Coriobacteriia bacterium]